jgi:alpha-amylase
MVSVCFYFHVHQPHRIAHYTVFDIGNNANYFDEHKNRKIIEKIREKCYLRANDVLCRLIKKHNGKFKVSFSITGSIIEQFEQYAPDVLESFKRLAATGCVEFLSETYNHSLAYIFSKEEFREQVLLHRKKIQELFGQTPTVFRNTELVFNNELARFVQDMGFEAILAEGADHILNGRSPNFVYNAVHAEKIKVLLKNYKLSDDVAFRFSNKGWGEYPLYAEKYAQWVNAVNGNGELINLFMDYETFGEHQWEDTGIFRFLERLPGELLKHPDNDFVTVSEAARRYPVRGTIDAHNFISWADMERDLTAWLGNPLQQAAARALYDLEKYVKATNNHQLVSTWRKLTTSDHFYYMCTKWFSDGDVHKYFNPYDSPYDAYIVYMNVLNDFARRVKTELRELGLLQALPGEGAVHEDGVHENPSLLFGGH